MRVAVEWTIEFRFPAREAFPPPPPTPTSHPQHILAGYGALCNGLQFISLKYKRPEPEADNSNLSSEI